MPKKKKKDEQEGQLAFISTVEVHRLQALVETQRRHIEDLNKQLDETLEIKRQQQLQLVERSPAPRNVRQLLARAAADNTALAKKVEELRAQRNALAVTKAALTAQLSELIRGAADDAQRDQQYRVVLLQLQQLCKRIGQHTLKEPSQQIIAVISYVQKLQYERQELLGQVTKYKRAASVSAAIPLMPSPTGHSLDQTATSQLVWDGECPDLFPATLSAAAASDIDTPPAAANSSTEASPRQTGRSSYRTAQSCFTDLSFLSPMRGHNSCNKQSIEEPTPCSRTPPVGPVASMPGAAYTEGDSPLSTQSLSMFSAADATVSPGSRLNPRRLDLATPVSKLVLQRAGDGNGSSSKQDASAQPESRDAEQRDQQQQRNMADESPQLSLMLMSPVFGVNPEDVHCPPTGSWHYQQQRSAAAAAATPPAGAFKKSASGTVGLSLEAEFRIAACDSLWPSPAVTAAHSMAAVCGSSTHSTCTSHALWFPQGDDAGSPVPARVLDLDFSPMPARFAGTNRFGAVSPLGVWFDDELTEQQEQQGQGRSSRRRWLVIGLCVVAPLTVAAAAGGAAAWHLKRDEVLACIGAVKCGAKLAAQHTQHGAVAAWNQCQQAASMVWAKVKHTLQPSDSRNDSSKDDS